MKGVGFRAGGGGRVQGGWWGSGFSLGKKGKGEGGGACGGWGRTGKGTGKSMRKLCRSYP